TISAHPNALVNVAHATFAFTGDDGSGSGIEGFQCRLDGSGWNGCNSGIELTGLSDGSHTFEVRAIDKATNADESPATYTWTVDTTAPITTITAKPNALVNVAHATFAFGAEDGSGSGVQATQCRLDEGAWNGCSSGIELTGLADGSHTFEVRATDHAANTGAPDSYAWSVDTTAPTATITGKPNALINVAHATFSFTGDDGSGSGIQATQCRLDEGAWNGCSTGIELTGLADGSHTFEVRAIDQAANTGTPNSYTWSVDTGAPDTTISAHPNPLINVAHATFAFTG